MKIGHTIYNNHGNRAVYRPDWDSTLPWICYANGTAIVHRGCASAAIQWMGGKIVKEFLP